VGLKYFTCMYENRIMKLIKIVKKKKKGGARREIKKK
jgi:hypothetical protein